MNMYSNCNQASRIALHCLNVLANSNIIIPKAAGWKHSGRFYLCMCRNENENLHIPFFFGQAVCTEIITSLLTSSVYSALSKWLKQRDKSVSFHCCHQRGYTSLRGEIVCDVLHLREETFSAFGIAVSPQVFIQSESEHSK